MNIYARHDNILKILSQMQYQKVDELALKLNASSNTIRNDINKLANKGKLIKIHGGATSISSTIHSRTDYFSSRIQENSTYKKEIAQTVLAHLPKEEHLSLFMDSSTTNLEIANSLIDYPYHLTVVTNFYDIALILQESPKITTFLIGGQWWAYEHCTIGQVGKNNIMQYHVNIALLGCKGIGLTSAQTGIYDVDMETTFLKQAMSLHAQETWICADHTKFDKTSFAYVYSFAQVHTICTDTVTPHKYIEMLNKHNVRVITPKS